MPPKHRAVTYRICPKAAPEFVTAGYVVQVPQPLGSAYAPRLAVAPRAHTAMQPVPQGPPGQRPRFQTAPLWRRYLTTHWRYVRSGRLEGSISEYRCVCVGMLV